MNNAKKLFFILKLIIVIASFGFVFYKIFNHHQLSEFYQIIQNFSLNQFLTLVLVGFLMFINWSIESIKWKLLVEKFQVISFFTALKAIFSGITISIFTPNRTGEFAGRIILLKNENRVKAIFSTFIGNIAQLTITILFGLFAISFIPNKFNGFFFKSLYTPYWISFISPVAIIILLFCYFNLNRIKNLLTHFKYISRYANIYSGFFAYTQKELLHFLVLSALRYCVFVIQYLLLLYVFNITIIFVPMVIIIFIIYFSLTIIPTIALGELGIRSSIAIFFLSKITNNLSGVFMASSTIWLINLAIPALLGSLLIYKSKI
ncbi:MAG: hypothetical protein GXO79_14605 [Chlorobi bacterium]|nr:hypothetical protein [Chlorobiota bacterium]